MQVRLPDLDPHLASLKQFALEVRAMQVAVDRPAKSMYLFIYFISMAIVLGTIGL